jgi:hypothetical protein
MATPASMTLDSSEVTKNLNKILQGLDRTCKGAMHAALLMVRRRATPLTPVDTGNLRRSMGTQVEKQGQAGYTGVIYYTSAYAPYVHEINKNYRAKGTQWKFLETALWQSSNDILKLFGSAVDVQHLLRPQAGGGMQSSGESNAT